MRNTSKSKKSKAVSSTAITPEWYQSADVRPKTFTARLERNNDGTYRIIRANVIRKVNQYKTVAQRVDVRDFARDLTSSDIYTF